jgi:hypothetical protein
MSDPFNTTNAIDFRHQIRHGAELFNSEERIKSILSCTGLNVPQALLAWTALDDSVQPEQLTREQFLSRSLNNASLYYAIYDDAASQWTPAEAVGRMSKVREAAKALLNNLEARVKRHSNYATAEISPEMLRRLKAIGNQAAARDGPLLHHPPLKWLSGSQQETDFLADAYICDTIRGIDHLMQWAETAVLGLTPLIKKGRGGDRRTPNDAADILFQLLKVAYESVFEREFGSSTDVQKGAGGPAVRFCRVVLFYLGIESLSDEAIRHRIRDTQEVRAN